MSFDSKNAFYRQGHFYDAATNKRIELPDETQVCIVAITGSFLEPAAVGNKPAKIKSAQELESEIRAIKGFNKLISFAPAGTTLYFSLARRNHIFEVQLLEYLYLYNCSTWKNPDDLNFYNCACQVTENINNSLSSFEPVYGTSLNDLYKNAYVHYLQNNGNPACNAATTFSWDINLTDRLEVKRNSIKKKLEYESTETGAGLF